MTRAALPETGISKIEDEDDDSLDGTEPVGYGVPEKIFVKSSSVPVLVIPDGNEFVGVNAELGEMDGDDSVELGSGGEEVDFVVETRSEVAAEDGVKLGGSLWIPDGKLEGMAVSDRRLEIAGVAMEARTVGKVDGLTDTTLPFVSKGLKPTFGTAENGLGEADGLVTGASVRLSPIFPVGLML